MPITFSNNTIKQLGTTLPTFYFDRIELHDEKIKLKMALYIDGNENEEVAFEEYMAKTLSKLNYYVMIVLDGEVSETWLPSNMPTPYLSITSDYNFESGTGPLNMYDAATTYDLFPTADTWLDLGLAPATSTGDAMVIAPSTDMTYTPVVPRYYPSVEVDSPTTSRMEDLMSGNRSVFELVRRANDYCMPLATHGEYPGPAPTPPPPSPSDYFKKPPNNSIEADVRPVSNQDLYHNPLTGVDPKFSQPVFEVTVFDSTRITITTEDPNLNSSPIGYEVVYPDNNGTSCNLLQIPFEDFSPSYEKIYKPSGDVVYKLSITIEEAFAKSSAGTETGNYSVRDFVKQLYRVPKFSMVAFTTPVDIDTSYTSGIGWCDGTTHDHPGDAVIEALSHAPMAKLNDMLASDVVYETVTINGVVPDEPFLIYREASGAIYQDLPIQTIDGLYYDQSALTLDEARESLNSLSNTINRASRTDPIASLGDQDIIDGISFVTAEFGHTAELLFQMNAYRKSIPDTSSLLYEEFKKLLLVINQRAKQGAVLRKELARSAVVVDFRHQIFPEWERGSFDGFDVEARTLNYINPWHARVSKYSDRYAPEGANNLDPDTDYGTMSPEFATTDKLNIFINGYFFFDYERALRQSSFISQLLDVNRIDRIFGRDLLASTFKVIRSKVELGRLSVAGEPRYVYTNDGTETNPEWGAYLYGDEVPGTPSTSYQTGDRFPGTNESLEFDSGKIIANVITTYDATTQAPYVSEMAFNGAIGTTAAGYEATGHNQGIAHPFVQIMEDIPGSVSASDNELLKLNSSKEYSYCLLRNFEFVEPLVIDNMPYRLMANEFQFVIADQSAQTLSDPTFQDFLTFEIRVQDNSLEIYKYLALHCQEELAKLETYLEAAIEFCSYNNIDGYFNSFFSEHQNNLYAGQIANAPWVKAPLVYKYMLDMLTNYYGGSMPVMQSEALVLSEKVNPETGSLDELLRFVRDMRKLYDNYFGETADAYQAYIGLQNVVAYAPEVSERIYGSNPAPSPTHGAYKNACTVYPLPALQEVYSEMTGLNTNNDPDWDGINPCLVRCEFGFANMINALHIPYPETMLEPDTLVTIPYRPVVMIKASTAANFGNTMAVIRDNNFNPIWGVEGASQQCDETWPFLWFTQLSTPGGTLYSAPYTVDGGTMTKTVERPHAYMMADGTMVLNSGKWYSSNYSTNGASQAARFATAAPQTERVWLYTGVAYTVTFALMKDKYDYNGNFLEDEIAWSSAEYVFKVPLSWYQTSIVNSLQISMSPTIELSPATFEVSAILAKQTQQGPAPAPQWFASDDQTDNNGRHWTWAEVLPYLATNIIFDGTGISLATWSTTGDFNPSPSFTGDGIAKAFNSSEAFRPTETRASGKIDPYMSSEGTSTDPSAEQFFFRGHAPVVQLHSSQITNAGLYNYDYMHGWDFDADRVVAFDGLSIEFINTETI